MSEVIKLNIKAKKIKAVIDEDAVNGSENKTIDSFYEENSIKKELENRFQSGFETGYKNAKEEMEKVYSAQLAEQSGQFYNILSTFEETLKQYESSFDHIVIEVSKQISKKILERELKHESIIEKSVTEAASKVLGANEVKIKLNPADLEKMNSLDAQKAVRSNFSKVNFEADDSVEIGGCLVDSEIGNVDARVSSQLNEVIKALENNLISDE